MNLDELKQKQQAIINNFGPWRASNIHLFGGFYTIGDRICGDEIKLRRVLQIVSDTTQQPFKNLRIVDLACHEGIYAIEFARHGANALGVEGRQAHIEKARFVKEALSLDNLDFVQDDVRHFSKDKYGLFDVVLCLGILYHLDAPDVFHFLERIGEACQRVAVFDTRIASGPTLEYVYEGTTYWGHRIGEGHKETDSLEKKIKRYWASLDNVTSFHLSKTSLYCLLGRIGFTSVYECYIPPEPEKPMDRVTLVAIKGKQEHVISAPQMEGYPVHDSPEDFTTHKIERIYGRIYRVARFLIPERIRVLIKSHGLLGKAFKPFKPAREG
jgi:hypothetical protein